VSEGQKVEAAFVLQAPFDNFVKILKGKLDPMQAMMTRKLAVKGSMSYMLRNVPTILCFVRCAQDVTESVMGE
jgi:putative sterol carrier protein